MFLTLLIASFLAAAIPCALFCVNLRRYSPPPVAADDLPAVSILIPARNEAEGIANAIHAALSTRGIAFELVIMDDSSIDATAEIVRTFAEADPRIRLEQAPPLPPGWNGKQHACWALAVAARSPLLCFVDADVRLHPDCLARMATFLLVPTPPSLERSGPPERSAAHLPVRDLAPTHPALVSGFPRQLTGTFLERILIPLIHFVLLGFLPLDRMRATTNPGFAAGCGQFFLADRDAYFAIGGHSGIPLTMHDGLRLPKLFRDHGYHTDLADMTELATVRMYTNARDTWQGLAKNATEGLGAPARIVPISLILLLGQVLPFAILALTLTLVAWVLFFAGALGMDVPITSVSRFLTYAVFLLLTLACTYLPRILAALRFKQSPFSALLHPVGILLLLAVQWYALLRKLSGRKVSWRGRAYIRPSA